MRRTISGEWRTISGEWTMSTTKKEVNRLVFYGMVRQITHQTVVVRYKPWIVPFVLSINHVNDRSVVFIFQAIETFQTIPWIIYHGYTMDIDKIVFKYPINIPLFLNKEHPINILMRFMVCWWVFLYSYPMTNPMKPIHLPSIRAAPGTWTSEERQARNQAPPIRTRGLPWRAQSRWGRWGTNQGLSWLLHLSGIYIYTYG